MAELVDAPDSKSGVLGRGGSIPSARTTLDGLKARKAAMRFVLSFAILACGVLALSAPAAAAKCVKMDFFDQYGAVIPTPQPVMGLLVGGEPVLGGAGPAYFSKKPAEPAPCPAALIEKVQGLFNTSCPTEARRAQAAKDNKVDLAVINKGCGNMAEALREPVQ